MKIPSIEEMWMDYATSVGVPPGGIQWRETRRAFFAAALSLLTTSRTKVTELSDDKAVEQFQAWLDEIKVDTRAFARENGIEPGF